MRRGVLGSFCICAAAVLGVVSAGSAGRADEFSYSFDELLGVPQTQIVLHPYDLGVEFDTITAMSIELAGVGTTHTWNVQDVSGGHEFYHMSDLWAVDLYEPPANHAATEGFDGSGPFSVTKTLFKNGDWSEMERGKFSLRPVPNGAFPAIYTVELIESTAQIELSKATLHVTGSGLTFAADADGDGDVDGADFLALQRNGGDAGMIAKWLRTYGAGTARGESGVPEAGTGVLAALAMLGLTAIRRGRRKFCRSQN